MFAVLLPVKQFRRSKQRLAGVLSPQEREALACAMFEDVWDTLRSSCARDSLFVITSEPLAIERCRRDRVPCRLETDQRSHSHSVAEATQWVMNQGVTSLLSVPIDIPAVTAEEISSFEELSRRYAVVVVPSADGTGTNALLRTPPDAIAPRFGPGSCALHLAEAEANGLPCLVHPVPSFAADIDTLEDAERFLAMNREGRAARLLRQWLVPKRNTYAGVAACR